jgi:hypothetical protein
MILIRNYGYNLYGTTEVKHFLIKVHFYSEIKTVFMYHKRFFRAVSAIYEKIKEGKKNPPHGTVILTRPKLAYYKPFK